MNSEKSIVYTFCKVITVILVVLGHVTRNFSGYGAFSPLGEVKLLRYMTEYIYSFHMPLFIFLSGTVYGICIDKGKYKQIGVFLKKKFERLICPYIVWGGVLVTPVIIHCKLTQQSATQYFLKGVILSKDSKHLWFLLALFWIFVIVRSCDRIIKMKLEYVPLLFSVILYLLAAIVPSVLQLQAACRYQLFFVMGYFFNKHYDECCNVILKYKAVVFIMPIILGLQFALPNNGIFNLGWSIFGIVGLLAISIVIVQRYESITTLKWFEILKNNSFGIYIFHPMLIYILFYYLGSAIINPYIFTVLVTIIAIGVSIFMTCILKKLNFDLLLGE